MDDLTITKLCAEAMGYRTHAESENVYYSPEERLSILKAQWNPLKDDAQAMMLVKKMNLCIQPPLKPHGTKQKWHAWEYQRPNNTGIADDLNRAICECVAKMQSQAHTQDNEGAK